jgi:hypothetical protein
MKEVPMARRKLTAEEMAAKVAKMKATKAANKAKALETLGLSKFDRTKKTRKKRVMTEEQKSAAAERLAKAREAKKPAAMLTVHESLRDIPDTDPFAPARVRGWIKNQSLMLKSMKSMKDSKDAKERAAYLDTEVYLANLQAYLRTGVYLDNRWGAERQHKVTQRCVALAYNNDGTPKRTVGVWYPDIGGVYTLEMEQEDNGIRPVSNKG